MQKHIVRICDLMGAWIDREAYLVSEVDAALAEKEEDWQLKYDLLIADYEQKWGLSMRQDEQIAALTEKLEFYSKNRTVQRLDALTAENKRLRDALEEISQFCDCEGPGCIYCEGDFHPPSAEAKIAQAALNQTGCTCGDDSHHGNDRHHAPTG